MKILVTGGLGYIGSHTCIELLENGYDVVILDNLCNSFEQNRERIQAITGRMVSFYPADLLDKQALYDIFASEEIDAVIHFAALKSISESLEHPDMYYINNVVGTLNLCEAMERHGVKKLIFSSTAAVYADTFDQPVTEQAHLWPCNPYGRTKLMIEKLLQDMCRADAQWSIIIFRYFNPIGAHRSGLIGEQPRGEPANLIPNVARVAAGYCRYVKIFGNDYPTADGTGVRDYVHVLDLAKGHVKAVDKLESLEGVFICNLGTGRGYSVLEVIRTFERVSGRTIPYRIYPRRRGDVAVSFCIPDKAGRELGWRAEHGIEEMCEDVWRWQMRQAWVG